MRNLMKEAHKLAKEIKAEYPNVDYKAQLGICISYLSKEGEKNMVELKGSEKQVKWASEIRNEMLRISTRNNLPRVEKLMNESESAEWLIENWKVITSKYKNDVQKLEMLLHYETQLSRVK